ncbi:MULTISPECIES: alpha/beta fold hydrolase [Caldilinea]|uniref:Putative hydrolase n=1 Tax=Caldilinea aerophila (strain DSM 14535 / JCM 11387 / NBRC 104270 / STL-6-O1) TaxID=926550 RepID=I0I303_CALAS|nr:MULTISPECIES: alpha/beta hydrolase [Caldilinea]BAL99640.1 putative hydrolase [Caldilinea aerophila DSM 14535 = NBRC 104270]GIV73761.1 MAG: alpha/beta hydrolase [Caldilinea sp.]
METIVLGNRTLAFRSYGRHVAPERLPLVLVHGAGGNHLTWPPQVRRLPRTAVYALDLPGHGASPPPSCATISAYSEVIRDFADVLELPYFVLAGHSMGGAIALDFALAYGYRLAGIVVIGAGARMKVSSTFLNGVVENFMHVTAKIVEYSYHPSTPAQEKERYLQRLRETDPEILQKDFLAVEAFDVTDRLENISVPTLILCGQEDRMTPPSLSQLLHRCIPNSQLHIIPNAGHNVMIEQPELVAAYIDEFITQLST